MKRGERLARRYAKALFIIGREKGDPEALLADLDSVTGSIEDHDELRRVLFTPIHPRKLRRAVLDEVASRVGLTHELSAFMSLLVDENRIALLPAIRDALRALVERAAGRVQAEIISARPLEDDEVERIRTVLSRRMQTQVSVQLGVDEKLIGGVIARIGDVLLDGSVRTQLASLAGALQSESA